jgi:hypothetical protein
VAAACLLPAGPAAAESAAQAQAEAKRAAGEVAALRPQLQAALRSYDQALAGVSGAVTAGIGADQRASLAQSLAAQERRTHSARARALYMAGGTAALYATVLSARSPGEVLRRGDGIRSVLAAGASRAEAAEAAASDAQLVAVAADQTAEAATLGLGDVEARYAALQAVLDEATSRLNALSAKAKTLAAAERAAADLARARATAEAAANARAAAARAAPVPSDMFSLYRAAAPTCPGLPWPVLAAIGQVETGHGRNTNVSSKGATGPMQFLPSTFAAYAVDGDRDGALDIRSPADAVFTAARYLCRNGGGSPSTLRGAIWNYNHADWYVAMVLRIAAQLAAQSGEPAPSVAAG